VTRIRRKTHACLVAEVADSYPRLLAWLTEGQVSKSWNVFGFLIAVLRLIPGVRWVMWRILFEPIARRAPWRLALYEVILEDVRYRLNRSRADRLSTKLAMSDCTPGLSAVTDAAIITSTASRKDLRAKIEKMSSGCIGVSGLRGSGKTSLIYEECLQQGKRQAGLDQHQIRTRHSFRRHTVLSKCAQALLAVAAARPAPPDQAPAAASLAAQPAAWRDTGKLPASANDQPPGDDPGLVKVSVPEARRLLRLSTAPMTRAVRDLGHAWSRWRRRHQARARWHHYHTRLKATQVT